MELRNYLNQRFWEIHNSTEQLVMNDLNKKLLTILQGHDLGMVGIFRDYRFVSIKTKYHNLLRDFFKVQSELSSLNINADISDILYCEHLYSFGYQNIKKDKILWSNIEKNFQYYLRPNQLLFEDCPNCDIDNLFNPIVDMDENDFDEDFLNFINILINSHYKTIGYKIILYKRRLSAYYNNQLISVLPENPNVSNLEYIFNIIRNFEDYKSNKKNNLTQIIDLFELL